LSFDPAYRMNSASIPCLDDPSSSPGHDFTGWLLEVRETVDTTNRLAASMPPWHAVRADIQTAGRGRTGRHWTSDRGGLWLSAVVPCPGPRDFWALLPLAVGHALLGALSDLGVPGLRLRWPNDLLVGPRKLAGLLVERHSPDTAVVGVGLNVFNDPERSAPDLRASTVRLADLAPLHHQDLDELASLVLRTIAQGHATLRAGEFPRIAAELNRAWTRQAPRRVALELAGHTRPVQGDFAGIDASGRLLLRVDESTLVLDPAQVALLREI
jgi:BirA family biotin operon repressor/biotin-[acetyl-CoA-carboxylase] ligase